MDDETLPPETRTVADQQTVLKLARSTSLSYDCLRVDLDTNGDFTTVAWGHGLGGRLIHSIGRKPTELPWPKDAGRVMLIWVVESKGFLTTLYKHTPALEEAATRRVVQC